MPKTRSLGRKSALSNLSYLGLLVVIVAAPFETLKPIFRPLGLELTNVELVLSGALLVWLVVAVIGGPRLRFKSPTTWPVLLLLFVLFLSTSMGVAHPGDALRFCGRFTAGILVYFLVFNELKGHRRLLGVSVAAVFVGTLVALLCILEYLRVPWGSEWLILFKTGPAYVGGHLRASSTLQYPTIASMYLEIIFGFGLGLLLYTLGQSRFRVTVLVFFCLLLIAGGIMVSQTRAGLLIMILQLTGVGSLGWFKAGSNRGLWVVVAVLLFVLGLLGQILVYDPTYWLRMTTSNHGGWYRAQFEVPQFLKFTAGEAKQVEVTITNRGRIPWHTTGESPFHVSYHWLHPAAKEVVVFQGLRTPFPYTIPPGGKIRLQARVLAPPRPGRYRLAWDLVQQDIWFSTEGHLAAYSRALIEGPPVEGSFHSIPLPEPRFRVDRLTLWRAAGRMISSSPFLGVGPDHFRLLYGQYLDLEKWDDRVHSNNMYVEFFVGTGLVGGILFLWLCISVLATFKRMWRKSVDRDLPFFLGVTDRLKPHFSEQTPR